MSIASQFITSLKTYREIKEDLLQQPSAPAPAPFQAMPGFIPAGSVLLGFAEDGLPLALDLYDPAPGPLLVAGESGSGKTALLQSLAQASAAADPGEVEFGVITPFPEEWTAQEGLPNSMGIWPAYHPSAGQYLSQLVSWAETAPHTRRAIMVLIDSFDLLIHGYFRASADLEWLLLHGPEKHVWPVVSLNPARLPRMLKWLEFFHTRLLGRIRHDYITRLVIDDPQADLSALTPGQEFELAQADSRMKFYLPPFA